MYTTNSDFKNLKILREHHIRRVYAFTLKFKCEKSFSRQKNSDLFVFVFMNFNNAKYDLSKFSASFCEFIPSICSFMCNISDILLLL